MTPPTPPDARHGVRGRVPSRVAGLDMGDVSPDAAGGPETDVAETLLVASEGATSVRPVPVGLQEEARNATAEVPDTLTRPLALGRPPAPGLPARDGAALPVVAETDSRPAVGGLGLTVGTAGRAQGRDAARETDPAFLFCLCNFFGGEVLRCRVSFRVCFLP